MIDWLRYYHSTVFDPKWRLAARSVGCRAGDVLAVFDTMLLAASTHEERGSLAGWRADVAAIGLEFDEDLVRRIYAALGGLVHDGRRLSAWDRRQRDYEDTTNADRQRRHRERKQLELEALRNGRVEERRTDSNHTGLTRGNLKIPDGPALDELAALLAVAAGPALGDPARCPKLRDLSPILGLMGPGRGPPCDLHRHVLPAIRAKSAGLRDGSVVSWNFYNGVIPDYRDACERGAPPVTPIMETDHGRIGPASARSAGTRAGRRLAIAEVVERERAAGAG
jgi:hypothetical protein